MSKNEFSWYKLINIPGFGTKSRHYVYKCLINKGHELNDLFEMSLKELEDLLPDIGVGRFSRARHNSIISLNNEQIFIDYQKLKNENISIVSIDNELYPVSILENLKEHSPLVLFCKGYLPLLQNKNSISIVGSRAIDEYIIKITNRIGKTLAQNGYSVSSGYAKGVDIAAHFGALEAGGSTTMILSHGTNYLTLKSELRTLEWEKNTLFVSQFLPYEKFTGANAMTRNKLVCALSKAVIVICSGPEKDKTGKQSGTFDAGKTAISLNIPLFVLTSEVLKTNYEGNNDLIKLGGIPINNGNELINNLRNLESITESNNNIEKNNLKQGTINFD